MGAVHADGIVSSDIVGYSTDSMVGGKFNMGGIGFTAVDGDDLDLNNITFNNLTKSDDSVTADTLLVWDANTSVYTTYYYYNAEGDEENWGWVDEQWELPDAKLAAGTAFWFKAKAGEGKSMTQSGAIDSVADTTYDIVGGKFNMLVNPFPAAIDLNDEKTIKFTNLTKSDDSVTADTLLVWDANTSVYTTYYYYNAEGDEENWGWVDEQWELPDAMLPSGTAFWFKAKAGEGKKITFYNPTK